MCIAYGAPAFALAAPSFLIQFYFLNFATDVLLIAPATVGLLLSAGRIWDAITDPMAGYWSDRTRSALGRRRPWMLLAAPAVAVTFVAVWSPPDALGDTAVVIWTGLALLLFTTAQTGWGIPHRALGAELGADGQDRRRIFGVSFLAILFGAVWSFGAMHGIANADDPRAAAGGLAAAAAVVVALALLVPPLALRERGDYQGRGAVRPLRAIRDVLSNPHARRLVFVWLVDQLALAAQGAVAPFMAIYILKRPDLMAVLPVFFIAPLMISIPIWIALARRFGARRVWLVSMLGASVSFAGLYGLRADDLVLAAVLLGSAGFWTGCGGPVGPALLADVIDDDERRTGERKEGVYFAVWAFAEKAGGAIVVLTIGLALQVSGFEPGAEQGPAADWAIRSCLAGLPAAMFAIGAAVFWRFRLES